MTTPAIKLTKAQAECLAYMAMTREELRQSGTRRFASRTIDALEAYGLVKRSVRGVLVTEPGWKYLGRVSPLVAEARVAPAEPVAKTAAEGRCDGGKWCRCRDADGRLIAYADALKPHNRTDARREVEPPTHTSALMVTWDTNTKHRGDGTRTACGKVGRLAQFADGYRATCTTGGCLEAWAN